MFLIQERNMERVTRKIKERKQESIPIYEKLVFFFLHTF